MSDYKSNLASVQRIVSLTPIAGADNIECARVLGWDVVVKKGEFNVGDLCCYIQIDCVVPETPEFEFLRVRNFRVRTIKLRKQISQGLITPLRCPPYCPSSEATWGITWRQFKEGDDLTEILRVVKYEKPNTNPRRYEKPPVPKVWYKKWWYIFKYNWLYPHFPRFRPKSRSPFPKHLVCITDEERIQNMPNILEQYKGKTFVASYKLDGSSITIIHSRSVGKSKYRICSRNFELHGKNNDWYKVFFQTKFEDEIQKLVTYFRTDHIIVQGEAIGSFNGNHHRLKSNQIRLFNIVVDGKRIKQHIFMAVCNELNIPHCPEHATVELNHSLEEILKFSEIKDIINPEVESEGLVWRCVDDNFSFKVINNRYLLNSND